MRLDTRVDLIWRMLSFPGKPVAALLGEFVSGDVQVHDVRRAFEELNVHAAAKMPSDVAMERPETGVVLVPLCDEVRRYVRSWREAEQDSVTTDRVIRIAVGGAIPQTVTLGDLEHVVPVKVHWVGLATSIVVPDDTDGGVRSGVVDISATSMSAKKN